MRGFFWHHHGRRRHHCGRDGGDAAHPGYGYGGYSEEQLREFAEDVHDHWRGRHRGRHHGEGWQTAGEFDGDGGFGVRRPLRFMAHKLELSDDQVAQLAVILNELKTERAQAAVDQRRTINSLADALASESFDETKVESAGADRVRSAEQLRAAVQNALRKVHALLTPEQRQRLAYLMRTGVLSI